MSAELDPIALDGDEPPTEEDVRRELREDTIHVVEYTPFPGFSAGEAPRVGFTRDLSPSGMCIGVDEAEPDGALLRVVMRDAGGRAVSAAIARVAWNSPARDGRRWLGLELIRPRSVGAGSM